MMTAKKPSDAWLLTADWHLREESAPILFGEVFPGLLEVCQAEGIRRVGFLGDFYHLRYRVPVALQNAVVAWLHRFVDAGIDCHLLPGNHDQIDSHGRNALEVLGELVGVTVYSVPTWTPQGLWVPYRTRPEQIEAALNTPVPAGMDPMPVCFIHTGVRGALRNNRMVDTEGTAPERFAAFSHVFCGHYHKPQALGAQGKIIYLGSPWETRADEAGDPKGFVRWEPQTRSYTRLDQHFGPRHICQHVASLDDIQKLAAGRGDDDFRLTLAEGLDMRAVASALESAGICKYTLTPVVEAQAARMQLPEDGSLEAYGRAYLERMIPDDARREAFWSLFETLTAEAPLTLGITPDDGR